MNKQKNETEELLAFKDLQYKQLQKQLEDSRTEVTEATSSGRAEISRLQLQIDNLGEALLQAQIEYAQKKMHSRMI